MCAMWDRVDASFAAEKTSALGTRVPVPTEPRNARLVSLDVFRGFTMFWLLGGKAFAVAVAAVVGVDFVSYQLTHSAWEGLRYYDLIWPSFMLMVGVSIPFSLAKVGRIETRGA